MSKTAKRHYWIVCGLLTAILISMAGCCHLFSLSQKHATQDLVAKSETKTVALKASDIPVSDWILELSKEPEPEPETEQIVEEYYEPVIQYTEPAIYYPNSNSGGLTRSQGVNYYDGRKETWYSSNQSYHYRTSEWTTDENGVYRDSDGYVVVAASDLAQGSTVETSHGTGKVYDSGCAAGTTDIYTAW